MRKRKSKMIAISSNLRIKKKARAHSKMYMIRGATLKRSQKWRRKLLEYRTRKVRRRTVQRSKSKMMTSPNRKISSKPSRDSTSS